MSRDDEQEGGLEGGRLFASCYAALQAARKGAGYQEVDYDDLEDHVKAALAGTVLAIEEAFAIAEEAQADIKVSELAHASAAGFSVAAGGASEEPDRKTLLVFEALVRHVANALDYDEADHGDMRDHEASWEDWVKAKLETP